MGTSVTTHSNGYVAAWARFLAADTAEAILKFYTRRAEAAPRTAT